MKYIICFIMMISTSDKILETEGFILEWKHFDNHILFNLSAPSSGWVAVGFTEGSSIVNTNLIQGSVKNGEIIIQDQYVTGFGEHPPVEALAVSSRIFNLDGKENSGSTSLSFCIYKEKVDNLHYNLFEGKEINIWLAYSVSDDFNHHSSKRIIRKVKL